MISFNLYITKFNQLYLNAFIYKISLNPQLLETRYSNVMFGWEIIMNWPMTLIIQ